jgi:hypothetical protein
MTPLALAAGLALLFVGVQPGYSDKEDAKQTAAKDDSAKSKANKKAKPARARKQGRRSLPPYYAQISLKDEQREEIYSIQAEFGPEIKKLTKQLKDLKAKRNQEIQAVLNKDQKNKLAALQKEAKARRRQQQQAKNKETKPRKTAVGN